MAIITIEDHFQAAQVIEWALDDMDSRETAGWYAHQFLAGNYAFDEPDAAA